MNALGQNLLLVCLFLQEVTMSRVGPYAGSALTGPVTWVSPVLSRFPCPHPFQGGWAKPPPALVPRTLATLAKQTWALQPPPRAGTGSLTQQHLPCEAVVGRALG